MSKTSGRLASEQQSELAGAVTFESASFGVVCSGAGGCGAYVATSERDRHRRFHAALAALIPEPRSAQE